MSFDWSTFLLEVLNFLVLVWLLQHFLYRPVLAVIERRRSESEKITDAAQALRAQAQALKTEYEVRMAHAVEDRERALAELAQEIAAERARRLTEVAAEITAERQRRQNLEARANAERAAERERHAQELAARFASRLLQRVASPALEDLFIDLLLGELQDMKPEQRAELQLTLSDAELPVRVVSAYPLSAQRQAQLGATLDTLAGHPVKAGFGTDAALKAGLRIEIGAWALRLNLHDELDYLASSLTHGD